MDTKKLAQEALDVAVALMQKRLGVTDGGVAGIFFSDSVVLDAFSVYAQEEIDAGSADKFPPTRPEGWKHKGRTRNVHVWHVGRNDYRVTVHPHGDPVAVKRSLGEAFVAAGEEYAKLKKSFE